MSTGDGRYGAIRSGMSRGRLTGRLAGMSLPRQIMTIAFWPLLEQVLSFIASSISLFIATHMGTPREVTTQIAAGMGAIGSIFFLGFVMQGAVSMGATAIVSRMTGARRFGEAQHAADQAAVLGLVVGALSFLVMYFSADTLVRDVFRLTPEAQDYARRFVFAAAPTAIFSGLVFAVNSALRGAGDTRLPFMMMLVADGLNMAASLVLVYGFGMSIEGLAIGMTLGFAAAALILVCLLERRRRRRLRAAQASPAAEESPPGGAPALGLSLADFRPDFSMIRRIVDIGLPQSFEVFGMWAIQLYCLSVISRLGDGVLGAHTIAIRIESLSFLPGFAIGTASASLVGLHLGAGSVRTAFQVIRRCLVYSICFMGAMGVLFFIFPAFFVQIFAGNSSDLLEAGVPVVRVFLLCEPFFAAAIVMKMSLRGAGDTRRVMWVTYGSMGFFRLFVLWCWNHFSPETLNLTWIWVLLSVDMVAQTLLLYRFVIDKKWIRRKV